VEPTTITAERMAPREPPNPRTMRKNCSDCPDVNELFPFSARVKQYKLLGPNGTIESNTPGTLGGNARLRIYGKLDCASANRALPGYAKHRVFFADAAAAIAAGYRPCGYCMRAEYKAWKASLPG
jgi:hypothetical protein